MIKKLSIILILFSIVFFPARSFAAEDDVMARTVRTALYGGLLGGLVGTAVMVLTDNPDEHYDYIPVGAAIGILFGTAYGLASDVVKVREEAGLQTPQIRTVKIYDDLTDRTETVRVLDILRYKF